MQYLRGYSKNNNPQADIGLFTLYKTQIQRQQLKQCSHIQLPTQALRNLSHSGNKQVNNDQQKRMMSLNVDTDSDVTNVIRWQKDSYNKDTVMNNEEDYVYVKPRRKKYFHDEIFTHKRNITLSKKHRKLEISPQIIQKAPKYHSPVSRLLNFDSIGQHLQINRSQQIDYHRIPTKQLKVCFPKLKLKLKTSISQKQELKHEIRNQSSSKKNKQQPQHQNIHKKRKKPSRLRISTDSNNFEPQQKFILISTNQYRLATERKEVPLISILKKYSKKI